MRLSTLIGQQFGHYVSRISLHAIMLSFSFSFPMQIPACFTVTSSGIYQTWSFTMGENENTSWGNPISTYSSPTVSTGILQHCSAVFVPFPHTGALR